MKKLVLFSLLMSFASPLTVLAQEQFLRLDSIVLIKSDLDFSKSSSNSGFYSGVDSITLGISSNQYLKVRSVTVVAKAGGYPGSTTTTSSMIEQPLNIYDFSVAIAGITVFSKEDMGNMIMSGRLSKTIIKPDILIPGQQLTGQQYLVSRTFFYDYANNHYYSYEIICEVVYYSKE